MLFPKPKITCFSKIRSLGFTLVEMLVSISIFAIITAVVLIRNNEFNSGILFSNLVYEIALSIREMQTYGITVRASDTGTSQFQFQNGYGVYFNKISFPNSFLQFTDIRPSSGIDPSGMYESSPTDEKLFKFNLKPGNSIDKLCNMSSGSCVTVDDLSITYMRPEPNAKITYSGNSGSPLTRVGIIIKSPGTTDAVYKCILVTSVGQISVQNYNGTACTP
jgi:prepilin-type N-terminal cleavage/methylation domain-containing protein